MFTYYIQAIKKYATFAGRAGRKEFWYFQLVNSLILFAFIILIIVTYSLAHTLGEVGPALESLPGVVLPLYGLFILLPQLAAVVRRLHDTGKSGWWIFITIIPFIGAIWHLINLMTDSAPDNQYGPNPKQQQMNPEQQTNQEQPPEQPTTPTPHNAQK